MPNEFGVTRTLISPEPPEFRPGSVFDNPELRINYLENLVRELAEYNRQSREAWQAAYDELARRLNELLVDHQENQITLTQWAANQDDLDPGDAVVYRFSTDASRNVTGMVATLSNQVRRFINVGSNDAVFKHQDSNSSAANRFLCDTGADITVSAEEQVTCWYDLTTTRWRVFSQTWT